jgi:hypothetical protein
MEKEVLLRVREAFLHGMRQSPSKAYTAPGRLFADRLTAEINSRLPEKEVEIINSCLARQHRALVAARKGDLDQSLQELQNVRSQLAASYLSQESILLIEVLVDPVEAYCRYRVDDYGGARALILSAVHTNQLLSTDYGYEILSAQRMQLCHNMLLITSREGRHNDTVILAAAFLDYLEFGADSLPEDIAWAHVIRDAVPESIMEYYFDQICGEGALAIAGSNDCKLFEHIAHHANPPGCAKTFAPHAHKWVAAKHASLRADVEKYLCQACKLLEYGKASELSLWFATIIDVVIACRSLGNEGIKVANNIFDEASRMPDAPLQLRSLAAPL